MFDDGNGHVQQLQLKAKLDAIVRALGVPVEVYLSCEDDYFRKPRPGCWKLLVGARGGHGGVGVGFGNCLYVGDAAGRPKCGTRKK
ncbi:unnamed protein product, partial [Choristocarpus tenellus]